jgi:hypothetical protein
MKTCSKCKLEKPTEEFAKKQTSSDGLYYWCRACCAEHKKLNKAKVAVGKKKWADKNRDKVNAACSKWFEKNRDKKSATNRLRYNNNLNSRLASVLRSRLAHAIRSNTRAGSAVRDLGCSLDEFRVYIAALFLPGMSWENWAKDGWHIDHIIPLSSAETPQTLITLCHYTNLQPLWAHDNLIKGAKWQFRAETLIT